MLISTSTTHPINKPDTEYRDDRRNPNTKAFHKPVKLLEVIDGLNKTFITSLSRNLLSTNKM